MELRDFSVSIDAVVKVSDETAARCLRLLEIWQDDNPNKFIICERKGGKNFFSINQHERSGGELK